MIRAATILVQKLHAAGEVHGIVSLGGSGGTSLAGNVMRAALPFGMPKLIVSTVASGDTSSFIGESDIVMVPSIVDIAGLNSLLRTVLENAAAAVVAMTRTYYHQLHSSPSPQEGSPSISGKERDKEKKKWRIAITMFGVTTPSVLTILSHLTTPPHTHEIFVFHATGTGGRAMERLINESRIDGVLDLTTTELADELVGGVMSAGPERLTAAAKMGVPQVVSLGALDMVNFGARESVPDRWAGRRLVVHNPSVTLMRTRVEECRTLGETLAGRLRENVKDGEDEGGGKMAEVWIPLRGISMIAEKGGPFHDEEADEALFGAVREGLKGSGIKVVERDMTINDPEFAIGMAERLLEMLG